MSAGAGFLDGYTPQVDATVVTRVLDAGATVLGKSVCEYLCLSGTSYTSWPAPVQNPVAPGRAAGGSSSGSAALVAAGEVDMALGGDQGGSIRIPAAWCGIVGIKPTFGLVPYTGIFSIDETIDHAGPMTRTVADNARWLEVLAGEDGIDTRQRGVKADRYSHRLEEGVRGLRIGVVRESFQIAEAEAGVNGSVCAAIDRLADLGAQVEEISIPIHAKGRAIWAPTCLEGVTSGFLNGRGDTINHGGLFMPGAARAMAGWRTRPDELSISVKVILMSARYMRDTYDGGFYGKSKNVTRRLAAEYDDVLSRFDVLAMPTTPQTATQLPDSSTPIEDVWQITLNMNHNTAPFCGTGHPSISVPCGRSEGRPVGLMLTGRHWEESALYRAAYALEQSVDWKTL
jgi:amidase